MTRLGLTLLGLVLCAQFHGFALGEELNPRPESSVDYVTEVRPILSDRCFTCHGPDAAVRVSELRMDEEASVHQLAVVPGDSNSSELIRRIESTDPDELMPPPDSNLKLSTSEREILRRWIDSGARFDRHWSFVAPKKLEELESGLSDVPMPGPWSSSQNPIDRMVARRLPQLELQPSPEADKTTLIRRLSFDLIGLPPGMDEIQQFERSDDLDAYERLVDRLLARPQFGEKWAVDWLDTARYADTYGYQADVYRAMWPWRDWVIEALNSNLSYDQFITWQLAGDLLPNATQKQILATAFNRNHRQTNEGGSVEEEFRSEYVADRVNTFGAAFLGLTLECARCHDHKYDPISQREYYQIAAFFNNIDESGLYSHFTNAVPTPALALANESQQSEMAELAAKIECQEQKLRGLKLASMLNPDLKDVGTVTPAATDVQLESPIHSPGALPALTVKDIADRLEASRIAHYRFEAIQDGKLLNEKTNQPSGKVADDPQLVQGISGMGLLLSGENNAVVPEGGNWTRNQPFSISFWLHIPKHFERCVLLHRSRAWTDAASRGYEILIEEGKASVALVHFWPGNAVRIVSIDKLPLQQWIQVGVSYDGSSRAEGLRLFVNGQQSATEVVRDSLTQAIHGGEANEMTVGQRFRDVGFKNGQVDELQIFEAELSELEMKFLFWQVTSPGNLDRQIAQLPPQLADQFHRYGRAERMQLESELLELRNRYSQLSEPIPEIMVMKELAQPRPTYILHRGEYHAPGEQVQSGVLSQIFPVPAADAQDDPASQDLSKNDPQTQSSLLTRVDLARWLTHPDHPLTARVAVNRIWQSLFGRGLVSTSEDFGYQGAIPTHPDLLDWLAGHFIHTGWDVKGLIKTIVMSKVYRQQSKLRPEQSRIDPENRWLARGPVVRLSAESVRDAALFASDLLVDSLGGPPVKPYQPDGLWEEKSNATYQRDAGEGSHRRSIYTFWKRTSPPPMMMTFDASNREVCMVRRQSTMTPLQTLVLLNDPQFVEAARGLAENSMRHSQEVKDRIAFLFLRLIARVPTDEERDVMLRLYQEQLLYFREDVQAAEQYLAIGDHRANASLDKLELAALTVVAQGLISYDEFVMKR